MYHSAVSEIIQPAESTPCMRAGTGLKAMLDAVSYKREIIVVTISGTYHVEMLLQLREDFAELGFAHFLVLTMKVGACLRN